MLNHHGTGMRLSQGDIGNAARSIGLPTAALLAWVEIEVGPNGRGFDDENRLMILPEPHRFYAELGAGAKRSRAVKEGLAYQKWGTKPYSKSFSARHSQLDRMAAIDEAAALKATSQGMPQILGMNHLASGYPSPLAMWDGFLLGEKEQLEAMCRLLVDWGLPKTLINKDLTNPDSWRAAALRYNGKAYAKHNYHGRLAAAFKKHSAGEPMTLPPSPVEVPVAFTLLQKGMKGEAVMNLQNDLALRGYDPGPIDGRYGAKTESAVRAFQKRFGLQVDGKVGPATMKRLQATPANVVGMKAPQQAWPQQQNKGWLAQLIDAILDVLFSLISKRQ